MIDEMSRRREDFLDDSIPVKLLDGQEWFLPRPRIKFFVAGNENGYEIKQTLSDPEIDKKFIALHKRYEKLSSGEEEKSVSIGEMASIEFGWVQCLLARNYTLTPDEMGELVGWEYGNSDDPLRQQFLSVIFGWPMSPKAEPGGDLLG